jgi:hypothetical protein
LRVRREPIKELAVNASALLQHTDGESLKIRTVGGREVGWQYDVDVREALSDFRWCQPVQDRTLNCIPIGKSNNEIGIVFDLLNNACVLVPVDDGNNEEPNPTRPGG